MPKAIENLSDIVGNKYGKLTVIKHIETVYSGKNREHYYNCECECGAKNIKVTRHNLLKGDTTSCGCAHKDAGINRKEDLTGQRFDRWLVIGPAPTRYSTSGKTRSIMWECKCDCGTIKNVGARALKTGMSKSCGCLQKERVSEALTKDLTGQRFGFLTVVRRNGSHRKVTNPHSGVNAVWHCKCDCGNECDVISTSLLSGDTTSCGCKKNSKYELYTEQYLESLGYKKKSDYFREKTFKGLKGTGGQSLRFDFYVELKNGEKILIECQGEQHFKSSEWFGGEEYLQKVKAHDEIKRQFVKNHNYRLIEIPYTKVLYSDIAQYLKDNNVN